MIQPLPEWSSLETLATFYRSGFERLYYGRKMQKCVQDLERYAEVINDTQPEVVVETGTRWGGSALWFSRNFDLDVITVDIDPQMTSNGMQLYPRVQHMVGSSTDPTLFDILREKVAGRRVMVSLDSDHHAPHVWGEIQMYGQLVSRGCFMVVEDACFDMWEGDDSRRGGKRIPEVGGPLKAINLAALDRDPRWRRDTAIEDMHPVSHSPCGWWERV